MVTLSGVKPTMYVMLIVQETVSTLNPLYMKVFSIADDIGIMTVSLCRWNPARRKSAMTKDEILMLIVEVIRVQTTILNIIANEYSTGGMNKDEVIALTARLQGQGDKLESVVAPH